MSLSRLCFETGQLVEPDDASRSPEFRLDPVRHGHMDVAIMPSVCDGLTDAPHAAS